MTVLIKGMEMPQGCYNCPLQHRGFNGSETVHYCYVVAKEVSDDGETDMDCPLIEVPTPHGRLIDADALMELYEPAPEDANEWEHYTTTISVIRQNIKDAPTVIEAEEGE